MMRKILPGLGLFLFLVVGFGLSGEGTQAVQAEPVQYPTEEQAFLAVLAEYMTITYDSADWQLGAIERSGTFAITIAQAGERVDSYQGFILLMARQNDAGEWSAVAPEVMENSTYNQWLAEMPDNLVNPFEKSYYYRYDEISFSMFSSRSIPLHHFPWAIRREAVLTQKDGSYHTHQLDFVMRLSDDIYASKPGLVIFVKDSSSVGGCDMSLWPFANFVVVQHSATEYSWYVHLKANSATVNVGDLIGYGTKIGEQGNTGFSCGSTGIHLHYMASSEIPSGWPDPNVPNYAPWPPSGSIFPVDFIESSYASLVTGDVYVSENASPPGVCSTTSTQVNLYDNTYCNSSLFATVSPVLLDLVSLGVDAKLESIELPAGWSASLYLDQNELGPKTCLNQSDSMLWDDLFSNGERVANNVVWARFYQTAGCPYPYEQGITLYPEPNFVGTPLWGVVGEITSNAPSFSVGSVYVPDGHSALIYDQDDLAGNSACLNGSALDLSFVPGWAGGMVESIELIRGDNCVPTPSTVPQPILIKPENEGVIYLENPEVCWQLSEPDHDFNVQVFDESGYVEYSGWIKEACWSPPGLVGRYGAYSWHVQARSASLEVGDWSATYEFTMVEDANNPTARFVNLADGGNVIRPRTNFIVEAEDAESGVAKVHFFAWYDDGTEVGYDWRYLGADEDGSDGWQMLWNLLPVVSEDAAAWVYVEDHAGNFESVYLSGLSVVDSFVTDGGLEGREGSGSSSGGEETTEPPEEVVDDPQTMEPPEEVVDDPRTTEPEETDVPEESGTVEAPLEESGSSGSSEEIEEPEVVVMPIAPAVVTPVFNEDYYQPDQINLCWEAVQSGATLKYQVEVIGVKGLFSPWMVTTCWKPTGLAAGSGSYTWQVRTRQEGVGDSVWSAQGAFRMPADDIAPSVEFLTPETGERFSDEVVIQLTAADGGSGLQMAQVLAWYDAGDGAAWHEISKQSILDGEIQLVWDVSGISSQRVQLWVYVTDKTGNYGSAVLPGLDIGTELVNPPSTTQWPKSLRDLGFPRGDD